MSKIELRDVTNANMLAYNVQQALGERYNEELGVIGSVVMLRVKYDELAALPTPNAIRGDKGAEAVYAIAGYIDYLRYDKAVKYADPTNVAVQTLRLSIAEDLERIASPAAPTQAAAKEESNNG